MSTLKRKCGGCKVVSSQKWDEAARLSARGVKRLTDSYKPVRKSGISKDNLQRLQAQHPDIYEQYVTVSESRRFYVKKQREEAA